MTDSNICGVCKGVGTIELIDSQCPFCNGTGENSTAAESYRNHTSVNAFSLIERCVLYVERNVIMILHIVQR